MPARTHRASRSIVLAALAAFALAACSDPAAPPAKTAAGAPPPAATGPSAPATPAGAPAPTAAPTAEVGAPAPAVAVDGYVFKKKLPVVGAKFVVTESETTSLTLNVTAPKAAKPLKVVTSKRENVEKIVENLAVVADAVTKVKVTYKQHSKVETEAGAEKTTTSPVAGKSYIVESKDGVVSVLSERGAAVSADEAKEVRDDFKSLGKPDKMQKAMPDGPIKVGDKVDSLAQGLRDVIAHDDDGSKTTVENSQITLASVNEKSGQKTGVFSIQLDLVMEKGDLVIRMKMSGDAEIRMEDGLPVSMSLQSPLMVKSRDGAPGPKVSGAGLSTMATTKQPL